MAPKLIPTPKPILAPWDKELEEFAGVEVEVEVGVEVVMLEAEVVETKLDDVVLTDEAVLVDDDEEEEDEELWMIFPASSRRTPRSLSQHA